MAFPLGSWMAHFQTADSGAALQEVVKITAIKAISAARTVREVYMAKTARLEYEERAASLLDANELKVAQFRIKQVFQEYMLQVPGAVGGRLVAYIREHGVSPSEHEVHSVLSTEIRATLEAFADEMTGVTS
jgi:hypothetical protein